MHNLGITFHISGQLQPQSPSVEVVPDNDVSLSAKIQKKTINYQLCWRHVNTWYRVMWAYYAYVTIRRTLGGMCFGPRYFVNNVSGQHFAAENKQEAAEFYSQHLPAHSRGVIGKTESKSNFPVSFSLISAEMNLVGSYRMLRGLQTVILDGLPSTTHGHGLDVSELRALLVEIDRRPYQPWNRTDGRLGTGPSEDWAVRWATISLTGGIFHDPVLG